MTTHRVGPWGRCEACRALRRASLTLVGVAIAGLLACIVALAVTA